METYLTHRDDTARGGHILAVRCHATDQQRQWLLTRGGISSHVFVHDETASAIIAPLDLWIRHARNASVYPPDVNELFLRMLRKYCFQELARIATWLGKPDLFQPPPEHLDQFCIQAYLCQTFLFRTLFKKETAAVVTVRDSKLFYKTPVLKLAQIYIRRLPVLTESYRDAVLYVGARPSRRIDGAASGEDLASCLIRHRHLSSKASCRVCVSLFRPANRNNRLQEYLDGLLRLVADVPALISPDWCLRVYADPSLWQTEAKGEKRALLDALDAARDAGAEILTVMCPPFLSKDGRHHRGLFGTVLRFQAAFDASLRAAAFRDLDTGITREDGKLLRHWAEATLAASRKSVLVYAPFYNPAHLRKLGGSLLAQTERSVVALAWAVSPPCDEPRVWKDALGRMQLWPYEYGVDEVVLNEELLPGLEGQGYSLEPIADVFRRRLLAKQGGSNPPPLELRSRPRFLEEYDTKQRRRTPWAAPQASAR